jgi:hypothetical protein
MTVGQVAEHVMRYWPAIVLLVAVIAAAAITNYRVDQNAKVLDILSKKLESKETDKAQWQIIRSLVEDTKEINTRLEAAEEHITPAAIQKWGEIQATVAEDHRLLRDHLIGHGR